MFLARGFTLLEMLVALAVFAVIGIISSQLLTQMISFADTTQSRGESLVNFHRAIEIMRRDFEQMTYRSVRDELGEPTYEVSIGIGNLIEFSRKGWINPNLRHRSQTQRVAYDLRGDRIYRQYWSVLDRSPDTLPVEQVLMSGITLASVIAIDQLGSETYFWPPTPEAEIEGEDVPALVAVKFEIETAEFGPIIHIWNVPEGMFGQEGTGKGEANGEERVPDLEDAGVRIDQSSLARQ